MSKSKVRSRRRLGALLAIAVTLLSAVAVASIGSAAPAGAETATVSVDFSKDDGIGHPEVFGSGRNTCNPYFGSGTDGCGSDTPAAMDTLRQSGVRFVRRDAYLNEIVPDTTIENYQHNVGGVADPANWDWSRYRWVDLYRKAGFKVLLIMDYNVPWNGYSSWCSVPRNFDVYADIVRKIYQHFAGKVDMIEVWNEPNLANFLCLGGSPYPDTETGRLAAYTDIYRRASSAIRSVDRAIPIGGPVVSYPNLTNWATALLGDDRIPRQNVNFLSYHAYQASPTGEAVTDWKQTAAAAGRGRDFPVYVTEWNRDPAYNQNPQVSDHPDLISYTASRLTTFFKEHANGSGFFNDNDSAAWPDFFGIYANGTLAPKSRTYRLLSEDLGLGDGPSRIRDVSCFCPLTNGGAATNSAGDNVAWVVNDGSNAIATTLRMSGLKGTTWTASVFEAGADQAVPSPKTAYRLTASGGSATVPVVVPAKSLIGVRLTPYRIADMDNLASAASITASSAYSADFAPAKADDGIIGLDASGEWASRGERTPSIRLDWPSPHTLGEVVLYDRPNPVEHIRAGRLVFSDNTTVAVPALPNDGVTGQTVYFPPRSVDWVRFEVTAADGPNVGLSEIQVYPGRNVAPGGTLSASSQQAGQAHEVANAVDGIVGQNTGDWASTEKNPWIQVNWVNSQPVNQVMLYDRVSRSSNVNGGVLSFSDGSSIPVSGVPADGTVKAVRFPAKRVDWVRFQAKGASGGNVGLSELRILRSADLASSAVVTASSAATDPALAPSAATDGTINQRFSGEWASAGELDPWIQLDWPAAQSISQVVLYDRPGPRSGPGQVNSGTLTFSDGSSVEVSGIDHSGLGKLVTFTPRMVTWVRFQVTGGAGRDVGLSEFEVFPPSGA